MEARPHCTISPGNGEDGKQGKVRLSGTLPGTKSISQLSVACHPGTQNQVG